MKNQQFNLGQFARVGRVFKKVDIAGKAVEKVLDNLTLGEQDDLRLGMNNNVK